MTNLSLGKLNFYLDYYNSEVISDVEFAKKAMQTIYNFVLKIYDSVTNKIFIELLNRVLTHDISSLFDEFFTASRGI